MRAYIKVKFDREINPDIHYISPGGYALATPEKVYEFDFNESCGGSTYEDDSVAEFWLRDEDYDCFPEIAEMREHLHEVTEIVECYIYTGEPDEPEINPVEIQEFVIEDWLPEGVQIPESTPYVQVDYDNDTRLICYDYELLCKKFNKEHFAQQEKE